MTGLEKLNLVMYAGLVFDAMERAMDRCEDEARRKAAFAEAAEKAEKLARILRRCADKSDKSDGSDAPGGKAEE